MYLKRSAALAVTVVLIAAGAVAAWRWVAPSDDPITAPQASPEPAGTARTLVLYDSTGPYAALGELYAAQAANLVSHFGTWTAHPVADYRAGESRGYTATVYIGSTYDEPMPKAFLKDVAAGARPVLWLGDNLWKLAKPHPEVAARAGFGAPKLDTAPVAEVRYKGTSLTRDVANAGGIFRTAITDEAKASAVGDAVRADGSTYPWGVRGGGGLTFIGEVPFSYTSPDDRYLAFADVLFEVLAPATVQRHRALVRIEDVGPHSDPAKLRQIADYLYKRKTPFAVAVIIVYDDATGVYNGGTPVHKAMSQAPEVIAALKYMVERGGTLIMHGYTHGYPSGPNPYGVSAEDFEFYRAHVDAANQVVLDGAVSEDSAAWAAKRVAAARREWTAAELPMPSIFEFPHYSASAVDYQTISPKFAARYERAMYYSGVLSGGKVDPERWASQYFPYAVRDVYGSAIIPETLGNVSSQRYNQNGIRTPADILASAKRQLVVRDGVASFFYHPFLGLEQLPELIEGIQAMGYTFTSAPSLILPK
ncbi:DUF2334 domain-containing protein [Pilimelia columellifera]|uniref:Polysaccharide deacetylase family protein n=1 Tax=Pilimelia columellifera subsp. columellifera TaxID=706583 RepID=A0ABN3NCX7_9ACTN